MTPIQPSMTDERLDRLVRQLLNERAEDVAVAAMPAQTMSAVVASHVRRGRIADRRAVLLVAAALLIALAAGAVAVGSGPFRDVFEPQPAPLPVVEPSPESPAPVPSDVAGAQRVFYTDYQTTQVGDQGCTEANAGRFGTCISSKPRVADPDGGNARDLFPQDDERRTLTDVSKTGDMLIYQGAADVNGLRVGVAHLAEIGATGDIVDSRVVSNVIVGEGCEGICAYDAEFSFSPDGRRLAYVRSTGEGDENDETVIAIQDVASGEVIELESTRATQKEGFNSAPQWSPDGSQILFSRDAKGMPTDGRLANKAVFIVNADGVDLRQLTPTELSAPNGAWSPDGSTIAFTSAVGWLGVDQRGKRENYNEDSDVYTVRADGSELNRLTNFAPVRTDRGVPVQEGGRVEGWTRDGRIVFSRVRWAGVQGDSDNLPPEIWVMDADGGNARQVDASSLDALGAAGCVDCPYPATSDLDLTAFWRPAPN